MKPTAASLASDLANISQQAASMAKALPGIDFDAVRLRRLQTDIAVVTKALGPIAERIKKAAA